MHVKSKFKLPYEPPQILDLGGGVAHAQGPSQCQAGGSPQQQCNSGATASGGQCQAGSVASSNCNTGSAPTSSKCNAGSTAAGGQCQSGSAAGNSGCNSGSVAGGTVYGWQRCCGRMSGGRRRLSDGMAESQLFSSKHPRIYYSPENRGHTQVCCNIGHGKS